MGVELQVGQVWKEPSETRTIKEIYSTGRHGDLTFYSNAMGLFDGTQRAFLKWIENTGAQLLISPATP